MASVKLLCQLLLTAYCGFALIGEDAVEARRSGGFRSSYRSARVRYGSTRVRYGTRVRVRQGVRYSYGSPGFSWQAAAAAGYIYGSSGYHSRRRYHEHPSYEPSICVNRFDYTMTNGSMFTMFICPMQQDPDHHTYCCGPRDRQKCCGFWDDGGRVFGVVAGILIFAGIIGLLCYCCCFRKTGSTKEIYIKRITTTRKEPPHYIPAATAAPASGGPAYPVQPVPPYQEQPMPFADSFVYHAGPTPNYPQNDQPSYPVKPEMPAPYPGAGPYPPTGPPMDGQPPYPQGPAYGPGPGDGAPYPPPGGSPYPPPGASPYPPPGGSPYPPPDGGIYPPPAGAPYPQPGAPGPYPAPPYPPGGSGYTPATSPPPPYQ